MVFAVLKALSSIFAKNRNAIYRTLPIHRYPPFREKKNAVKFLGSTASAIPLFCFTPASVTGSQYPR
jgi:hypothetical protein